MHRLQATVLHLERGRRFGNFLPHRVKRSPQHPEVGAESGCGVLLFPVEECVVPPGRRFDQAAHPLHRSLVDRGGRPFGVAGEFDEIIGLDAPDRQCRPQFEDLGVDVVYLCFFHIPRLPRDYGYSTDGKTKS